jgi:hypothetical protein
MKGNEMRMWCKAEVTMGIRVKKEIEGGWNSILTSKRIEGNVDSRFLSRVCEYLAQAGAILV